MSTRRPDSTLSDRIALNLAAEREKAEAQARARSHRTLRRAWRRKRAKQREAEQSDRPATKAGTEGGGR